MSNAPAHTQPIASNAEIERALISDLNPVLNDMFPDAVQTLFLKPEYAGTLHDETPETRLTAHRIKQIKRGNVPVARDERITLKLTQEERTSLDEQAKDFGISPSTYARMILLKHLNGIK